MTRVLLILAVLLLASSASAQTPEPTGMAPAWAVAMFAAQAGDLISTEVNHAHGLHESNVLMKSRYVRYPIKILGPIATYYAVKHLPRSQANKKAWGWTISGFGMTGVNVTVLKVWGK